MTRLAICTDAGNLRPALVTLGTALTHTPSVSRVAILGHGLDRAAGRAAAALCQHHEVDLRLVALEEARFDALPRADPRISPVALAKLLIPGLCEGRVLYLDTDTLVRADLSPLLAADLAGHAIGAVRDAAVVDALVRRRGHASPRKRRRIEHARGILGAGREGDYVNSGVLLFDCDRIRARPGLADALADLSRHVGLRFPDQDTLNALFRDDTRHLSVQWNSIWGRGRRHRRLWRAAPFVTPGEIPQTRHDAIVHYAGPSKPWLPVRAASLARGRGLAIAEYRRAARPILSAID